MCVTMTCYPIHYPESVGIKQLASCGPRLVASREV
jgi:hypothetical protein